MGSPLFWVDPQGLAHSPDSSYCQDLLTKIQNIKKDLEKRYKELGDNPNDLPEYIGPGERLRDTRRGHQVLINMLEQRLRELEERYDNECTGKNFCQRNPKTCAAGATIVVLGRAAAACAMTLSEVL